LSIILTFYVVRNETDSINFIQKLAEVTLKMNSFVYCLCLSNYHNEIISVNRNISQLQKIIT